MIADSERARVVAEIVAFMLTVERYDKRDLYNAHALDGVDRRVEWEAREIVRVQHGIAFVPVRKHPFLMQRGDYVQIARNATSQRASGTRKHRRAEEKLRLASAMAPDANKERLSDAADRLALRLAMRAAKT